MATKKSKPKGVGRGGNYNLIHAVTGTVGAPPLVDTLSQRVGKEVHSVVIRVDADFAEKVKRLAAKTGRTVTSITRELAMSL